MQFLDKFKYNQDGNTEEAELQIEKPNSFENQQQSGGSISEYNDIHIIEDLSSS